MMRDKEARDLDRLEAIRLCSDLRRRIILGALLAGSTQGQLEAFSGINITQSQISRIATGKSSEQIKVKRADQI
jgi:hypothetical protein